MLQKKTKASETISIGSDQCRFLWTYLFANEAPDNPIAYATRPALKYTDFCVSPLAKTLSNLRSNPRKIPGTTTSPDPRIEKDFCIKECQKKKPRISDESTALFSNEYTRYYPTFAVSIAGTTNFVGPSNAAEVATDNMTFSPTTLELSNTQKTS